MSLDGLSSMAGTAITLTSHVTHDNMGEDPPPLSLDVPEETTIQLPDDCAVVPYIDEYAGDITLSSMDVRSVSPTFAENPRGGKPEEAWLKHLYTVVFEEGGELQEMPVTYSAVSYTHLTLPTRRTV